MYTRHEDLLAEMFFNMCFRDMMEKRQSD